MFKKAFQNPAIRFFQVSFLFFTCLISHGNLTAQERPTRSILVPATETRTVTPATPARMTPPPRTISPASPATPHPPAARQVNVHVQPAITPIAPAAPQVTPQVTSAPRPKQAQKIINPRTENPEKASTSTKTRAEIIQKIPFQKMTPDAQQKVRSVLSDITMYRRLPVETVLCEEDMYVFLTKHPDVVVNLWEVLKVSNIRLREIGPERFYIEDQAGTQGTMECVYRTNNFLMVYVNGTYEGPPFPSKVVGSGVIILQYEPISGPAGENMVAIRLDSFIKIHNGAVDFLAKTFQAPLGKVADGNLNQTVGFLAALTRTIYQDGESVQRVGPQLKNVRPNVREEFSSLTVQIMKRQEIERFGGPLPVAVSPSHGEWR